MRNRHFWNVLVTIGVLLAAGSLIACATAGGKGANEEPYTLATAENSEYDRVILTEQAATRLDIQVIEVGEGLVPYSAVLYDTNGDTFVYTNPEPLTYVRAPIVVESIEGNLALLSDGPPEGTRIVTVGGAELVGIEFGVGK